MRSDLKNCSLDELYCIYESLDDDLEGLRISLDSLHEELETALDDIYDDLESVKLQFSRTGSLLSRCGRRSAAKFRSDPSILKNCEDIASDMPF